MPLRPTLSLLALLFCLSGGLLCPVYAQGEAANLLRDGGFEGAHVGDGKGAGIPGWDAFGSGYSIDLQERHTGAQSIKCASTDMKATLGARYELKLNQKKASPVLAVGWSKALDVSGSGRPDYSLYADLEYMDGTPQWGIVASFGTGTHDWERRQLLILPKKPIKTVLIYALFRQHSGTAWFDDFSATELTGANIFDNQAIAGTQQAFAAGKKAMLTVRGKDGLTLGFSADGGITDVNADGKSLISKTTGGLFLHDVAANGPMTPLHGTAKPIASNGVQISGNSTSTKIGFSAKVTPSGDALSVDGEITDLSRTDRAITVYFVLPIKSAGWNWGSDIRHSEALHADTEFSNQVTVAAGATGGLSLYPFGSVSGPDNGVAIGNQIDWPSVYRIFYNGTNQQFVIAWDLALTGKTKAWKPYTSKFRCTLFRLAPAQASWGFRAASQRFYDLNPQAFGRRTRIDGIWMPFTDPSTIKDVEDFGFAFHEGDNSIKSDDALGILSFRYTEPMTYWMPMEPAIPRTYENAMEILKKNAAGTQMDGKAGEARSFSRAVINSGTFAPDGRYNLEFQNAPWANGAVFAMSPLPQLPASAEQPTKAYLNYNAELAEKIYGPTAKATRGEQDGEYLDSLEGWADYQDYRPSNLQAYPYPLTFDTDSRRPMLPEWFATYAYTRYLSEDLHRRGKLLMANTTPVRFSINPPLCDLMGIETNWLDATTGKVTPDSDETYNLRRTMCYHKPYLLLMNTNYDKFTSPMVEKYFQRSLFYGVFPSMFSVDAANSPYWEAPRWYNRDRPLFKKYLPIIKKLSAAGWEPITYAASGEPTVYVERYGKRYLTIFNDDSAPHDFTLKIDLKALGVSPGSGRVRSLLSRSELSVHKNGATLVVPLRLDSNSVEAVELY